MTEDTDGLGGGFCGSFSDDQGEFQAKVKAYEDRPKHSSVDQKVSEILNLIDMGELPMSKVLSLKDALTRYDEVTFDEEFDQRAEISSMMIMARAMKEAVLGTDFRITSGTTITEVKQALDTGMKLSQMLSKLNKDIMSVERGRALEACFLAVVGTMPMATQKSYAVALERKMLSNKHLSEAK